MERVVDRVIANRPAAWIVVGLIALLAILGAQEGGVSLTIAEFGSFVLLRRFSWSLPA